MPRQAETAKPSARLAQRLATAALAAAGAAVLTITVTPDATFKAQQPGPCDPPNSNQIVCENQKAGDPASEWDINGAGDATIQGFTTDISVDQGQTVSFKIDTTAPGFQLDIYRMGYYGGMGARKVATVPSSATLAQNQSACLTDAATGLIDCGNWAVSATWTVPSTAVSGVYFAKATRIDTGGASHILFVVRDDDGRSDLLFQTSDTTWQAYNQYGGNSLYTGSPVGRAYKVSYNRPITVRGTGDEDSVFNAEYPMVRWIEANGYNVSYSTGVDSDRRGAEILEHKVFLSVGHDEYWSGTQRTNVENARAAGVHLAFFSGNEVFWKTRWENSISAGGTPYRTLVAYKETHANAKIDPTPNVWTGTWRDPRFSPPADGGRPENALTGTLFYVNSGTTGIRIPAAEGKLRFWRNTAVANLSPGAFATMPNGTLGYEWDEDQDNGFRPAGLIRLSDTTVSGVDYLQDFGSSYALGTANHALTLYRHASGAYVFGAGTVQWAWGLDSNHDRGSAAPSLEMQQATVNLFADMSVQPLTIQAGLVGASPSTDTLAPTSAITSLAPGATVPANTTITVSGTATDAGGGIVAGVEVSADDGVTWSRAVGGSAWSFAWQTGASRAAILKTRAVDDSGNLEQPGTGTAVTVGSGPITCPCSLWNPTQSPATPAVIDGSAVEVGTRFRSDVSGYVTAIRFYKSIQNTGTHIGNIWTDSGTLLSTVTFASESSSGWQEATFPSPVAITSNTTYVVSYHTNTGFYAGDERYFATTGLDNGPLHAPRDGQFGANGVYKYGATGFPTATFQGESYWVDVVLVTSVPPDTTPPSVSNVTPPNGATAVSVSTTLTAVFSEGVDGTSISGATFELRESSNVLVPASVSYSNATRTATLSPSAALKVAATYTGRLVGSSSGIKDTAGNFLAGDYIWSLTTAGPPPTEGPGGPILVISQSGNPFSRFYAEILRAEGLNEFTAMDLAEVSTATLASYDVVILGEMPLTTAQVAMFSSWVNGGGNLIAMRPDKKLAALLGLTDAGGTLAEAYLLVNTFTQPGAGIFGDTMQYHGTADRFTLNGAEVLATLHSNATTATSNPAVTLRSVGSAGGQAAAFTYDLAKSIVFTRQGNPAWSGQERDGSSPVRSDDLFFGGAQTDWVDLNKVAVPQADEQQRLLANLIGHMNIDRTPLPRFWYFPRGKKAVVIMTGDDHANNGTSGRFDQHISQSAPGCRVDDWDCVRATSYIYPSTPISNEQAAAYVAQGFEIGVHISTNCANYTSVSLQANYVDDLAQFATLFPSLPAARTNRTHCIVWSDFDTQSQVALANGIRLDTNYYYYPGPWVLDRPGFMTGSGMPMRFAKADGTMLDVYQAATQMTDESAQSYPFTPNTLFDRALGPEGFYGAFTANMHTDVAQIPQADAIVASALSRSVPVISAQQMLTWLDGRNSSSFGNLNWDGTVLSFTIAVGSGANGLEAMVPVVVGGRTLTGITRAGAPVSHRVETIKGVAYAFVSATPGSYAASYAVDNTAPVISNIAATPASTTATITWNTNEVADRRVDYGLSPTSLTSVAVAPGSSTAHEVTLSGLSISTTYYYRVRSIDPASNVTTAPASPATFTTTADNCPCTIWPLSQTPSRVSDLDGNAVELGVKFRTSIPGYITGVRFYKGSANTGTHVGNLWSEDGVMLASAVFTTETLSGWQQVTFGNPVAVTANTTYVASYHAPNGRYAADDGYFATAVTNGPLQALPSGTIAANGVYRYGASDFPNSSATATNYWVDVVFVTTLPPDTTPPTISSTTPGSGSTGVGVSAAVSVIFSEMMDPTTISTGSAELRDPAGTLVAANVSYSAPSRTASVEAVAPLLYSTTYAVTVRGGSTGVKDVAGNAVATDYTWSFSTGPEPPPPPNEGPGGPVLVIAHIGHPFTRFYGEILKAEGLNAFTVADSRTVTPAMLAGYDVVILGEMPLSSAQVAMLTDWVTAGGNLIAMRPDKQLAELLGLADANSTLSNGYLQIDTSTSPGAGIVSQTMQFHGTADRYTVQGALPIATLFSNATTGTANPAVTVRSVGGAGGQAAAFTFDLARSIVYTRQGNPAWSGRDRDGQGPIRSDDLFFGGTEPDWVDLSKIAVPQADEQQRLLANLIAFVNFDRKPLPKFWYFPYDYKAVVVMTGDDHGNNGTTPQFDTYTAYSAPGCSVEDWQCVRATSYVYIQTPITQAKAAAFNAAGFEIGLHTYTGCDNYTRASLTPLFPDQLASFADAFPGLPAPTTNRTHCIVWSDYASQAEVERANGIRLDTNYYYFPAAWVNDAPGLFTGSGIPMRFARADGTLIDVYQAATQMTDESGQTYPITADVLLDRALGAEGYYGAFVANMHTDTPTHDGAAAIVASAQARGVPVISARQLLTWLDGREGSSFGNLTWNGNSLTFTVTSGTGARGLRAMVPVNSSVGQLQTIARGGTQATYTAETIKGVTYAFFSAVAGDYVVQYEVDTTPPIITALSATSGQVGATITWRTNETASSRVHFGSSPDTLASNVSIAGDRLLHSVQLTGLSAGTTYYYRATSVDTHGNSANAPTTAGAFTTTVAPPPPSLSLTDTTVAEFNAGFPGADVSITQTVDGELSLRPAVDAEFFGTALSSGWSSTVWNTGGVADVAGGMVSVDGARVGADAVFAPGQSLEFVATFGAAASRHVGFGVTLNETPWAIFSTGSGNALYARTNTGAASTDTLIAGNWLDGPHRYRVEWLTSAVVYSIDGVVVASHSATISTNMRPLVSDYAAGSGALQVDWIRMGPHATSGTFTSRVLDAGSVTTWGSMSWTGSNIASGLDVSLRFGNTVTPDESWTPFALVASPGASVSGTSRYLQYAATLSGNGNSTPIVADVTISAQLDTPLPLLTLNDVTVVEGDSGATIAMYTVQMSRPSPDPVSVVYSTADGTATAGTDYVTRSDTITFAPGTTSVSVPITILGDAIEESDETFGLNLTAPTNAALLKSQGTTTITNDDVPTISIADASITEGNTGARSVLVRVTLSSASTSTISAQYITTAGTAASGVDFTPASGTVTFAPDATQAWVSVSVLGDAVREPDETLVVAVTAPVNATIARPQGSVTIVNDDLQPQVSIADTTVVEGNAGTTNAVFSVTLTAAATANVVMSFTTSNGTAVASNDYVTTSGPLTIPIGATSATITVPVIGDIVDELNETYLVTLSAVTGATVGRGQATGTITDDDSSAITITDVTVNEGTTGTSNAVLTVALSTPSALTVTVNHSTADGTAVAPGDYTTRTGTLSFAPGTTSAQLSVPVVGDTRDELNEVFTVNLSAATNATIGDGSGNVTIIDNDAAPSLSIGDITRAEGNTGTASAVFTVTLSAASGQTITVAYATSDGTAVAPGDYTATSGTLTIAAGATSGQILVPVVGDVRDEPNETFFLSLSNPTNATLARTQAAATITDNDAGPSIVINNVSVAEGNIGAANNAVFTVTLSTASSFPVTVNYATSNGTATAPGDYTAVSGALSFAPDSTTAQITVPIAGDILDEANDTFNVNLSGPTNATIGDALGVGTITDDDATPTIVITNVSISEPVSGSANVVFTVTMSAVSGRTASANYATQNATATAGTDYTATTGILTFAPGVTSGQISVPVLTDTLDEANETFNVNLGGAVAVTIADSQGVSTIVDDDPLPTVSINDIIITEGPTGTSLATFTVTLSTASGRSLSVGWTTVNGTATSPGDYAAASGTLTFAAGVVTQTISIVIGGDAVVEPNETFVLNLRTPTNVTIADSQGVCTILNDD